MQLIYTGYYLDQEGHIYDANGSSHSRLDNNSIVYSNGDATGYSIYKGNIVSTDGTDTGYHLRRNQIFGPFRCLPWLVETNLTLSE